MKLCVIYNGGTIGMVPGEHGLEPGADVASWLHRLLDDIAGLEWTLASLDPVIDSSDIHPRDWQRLLDAVRDNPADAHVVLHGTDTMAYSSAALAAALGQAGRVVFTGAQRSLVETDSDARGNVMGAVRCAMDERWRGVMLWFDGVALAGDAATKVSSIADHAFESPARQPLARMVDDVLVWRDDPTPHGASTLEPVSQVSFGDPDVVVLTVTPGLRAPRVRAMLTPPPDALVLRSYGSGNLPTDEDLQQVLTEAAAAGTRVLVTSQCPHGGVALGTYAASAPLVLLGAEPCGDATVEAVLARLCLQA